ncbi:MAG: VTT domain-containing protein [Bryocella sp.]
MKLHPIAWMHAFSAFLLAVLQPFGIWGLAGLAIMDAALLPIPGGLDGVLVLYVSANHHLFLLYVFVGSAAAALGSLVPFYVGRAGGELFLLKRINRQRYEKLRDRFEKQEFLAILIPSLGPPPTPLKLFQFAAGVFEMKPLNFMLATFIGKFTQFFVWSLLLIWFGPKFARTMSIMVHRHLGMMMTAIGFLLFLLGLYIIRKIFDRKRGLSLPVEETEPIIKEKI